MSAKHARRRRHPILHAAALAAVGIVPFALHANSLAVADTGNQSPTVTLTAAADISTASGIQAIERTARSAEREARERRAERQRELREERERRQEERERLQQRRERADQREFTRWVMPVPGAGWSAGFGDAGSMWSSGFHTGQDFTASIGTPVHAASGGIITFAGWSDAYGNKIEITHPDGNQTWYAHMTSFERTSGTVQPGEVIGYVGCTGNCFGPHLHFEFHPGSGDAVDPVPWLREHHAF